MTPQESDCRYLLGLGSVFVRLNTRAVGVSIPAHLRVNMTQTLCIGYKLTPAIPDLTLTSYCVTGTLSFYPTTYLCVVPWSAVYELSGGGRTFRYGDTKLYGGTPRGGRPFLRVIKGGKV